MDVKVICFKCKYDGKMAKNKTFEVKDSFICPKCGTQWYVQIGQMCNATGYPLVFDDPETGEEKYMCNGKFITAKEATNLIEQEKEESKKRNEEIKAMEERFKKSFAYKMEKFFGMHKEDTSHGKSN